MCLVSHQSCRFYRIINLLIVLKIATTRVKSCFHMHCVMRCVEMTLKTNTAKMGYWRVETEIKARTITTLSLQTAVYCSSQRLQVLLQRAGHMGQHRRTAVIGAAILSLSSPPDLSSCGPLEITPPFAVGSGTKIQPENDLVH